MSPIVNAAYAETPRRSLQGRWGVERSMLGFRRIAAQAATGSTTIPDAGSQFRLKRRVANCRPKPGRKTIWRAVLPAARCFWTGRVAHRGNSCDPEGGEDHRDQSPTPQPDRQPGPPVHDLVGELSALRQSAGRRATAGRAKEPRRCCLGLALSGGCCVVTHADSRRGWRSLGGWATTPSETRYGWLVGALRRRTGCRCAGV